MFSFISMNWEGKPFVSYEIVIKLLGSTKTRNGLTVTGIEDNKEYANGIRHIDEDMAKLQKTSHEIYAKWDYMILPQKD